MRDLRFEPTYGMLDPRAFLRTRTVLWANRSDNPRSPLLRGHVLVPVRLFDFCYQKCKFEHFFGEQCVKLNLQFWENMNPEKSGQNPRPDYVGTTYINIPSIIDDHRGYYEEIQKIRNFGLSYNQQ